MEYIYWLLEIFLVFTQMNVFASLPYEVLNTGYRMPLFGLGTYTLNGREGEEIIKYAIDIGYRHIDTASYYKNEREVGNAVRSKIRDNTVKREELFITSKLNVESHQEDDVVLACKESLKELGLEYIDLFLIHSPISWKYINNSALTTSNIDYLETWKGMEKCKNQGLVRSIGISNFNSKQITRLLSNSKTPPANHQIEVTLNLNQKKLIEFCRQNHISVSGYSPLGSPTRYSNIDNLWSHSVVQNLSKKYGKTPAQISLRFVFQMGAAPLPKSSSKARLQENINIFDFALSDVEMDSLMGIGTGSRLIEFNTLKDAEYYPFDVND